MSGDALVQAAGVTRPSKSVRLREARFEDHPEVAALETKFELVPKSYEEWMHLWADNPACREMQGKFPIGWVLENADGAIVGYLGNIPVNCELEARKLLAATTRAWVVEESARSYALLLLATYFKQDNVELFLNTSVNSESARAYGSFQGIPVPVGAWDRSLFWITNYRGFAESFLRKKGGSMARPLSYPLSGALFLADQFRAGRFSDEMAFEVQSCAGFDDRFESFWMALRKMKHRQLLSIRNREALEWHFKYSLLNQSAWIYTWGGSSGLAAYSIFDRQDYHPFGLTRMRLTDFQCLDEEKAPAILNAMLKTALARCRRESFHMLELTGLNRRLESEVERASPHHRQLSNWRYFYKANRRDLGEKLKNADLWDPSFYDGDSSL